MRRREFINLFGGVAATWPLAARAQQSAVPVIGFLRSTTAAGSEHLATAFEQGLKDAGFVAGQNVAIDYRWGNDQSGRLPGLAADLIRRRPAVIIGNISGNSRGDGRNHNDSNRLRWQCRSCKRGPRR
jgi:putative ABC transport system substrate-binding protein